MVVRLDSAHVLVGVVPVNFSMRRRCRRDFGPAPKVRGNGHRLDQCSDSTLIVPHGDTL
jgi:hypothetical protein